MTPRFVLPALALILLAAPVTAQQQQPGLPPGGADPHYSAPKPGISIVYDTTNATAASGALPRELKQTTVMTVTAVEGDEQRYDVAIDGTVSTRAKAFRGVLTIQAETEAGRILAVGNHPALRALWPLAVGRNMDHAVEARFARRDAQTRAFGPPQTIGTATQRWSVEARETVTIPAGTFDVYLIRRQWDLVRRGGDVAQTGDYRIWLEPALGWYVRFEGDEKSGDTARRVVHVAREIKGR